MRHRVKKHQHFKKKDIDHRNSMLRNLMTSLFTHKSIVTTEKRATAIVGEVDRLINVAKSENKMNAIRAVMAILFTKQASVELFEHVAPKFPEQSSGFTRMTPIKYREGDAAKVVKLEFVK